MVTEINEISVHCLFIFAFRYEIRQIRKTMFTKLSIPVYQYTQKLILYHDIQRKYRYFDISIRIAHHYLECCVIIINKYPYLAMVLCRLV